MRQNRRVSDTLLFTIYNDYRFVLYVTSAVSFRIEMVCRGKANMMLIRDDDPALERFILCSDEYMLNIVVVLVR